MSDPHEFTPPLRTEFVVGPRRSGRTSALIAWVLEAPESRVLVCPNSEMAKEARRREPRLSARHVVSARAVVEGALDGRAVSLAIDNYDLCDFKGQKHLLPPIGLASMEHPRRPSR